MVELQKYKHEKSRHIKSGSGGQNIERVDVGLGRILENWWRRYCMGCNILDGYILTDNKYIDYLHTSTNRLNKNARLKLTQFLVSITYGTIRA